MPLVRPEVKRVLQEAGIEKDQASSGTISDKLASAGLSDNDIAEGLSDLARNSNNEALRLRALETVAKIRGALKDQPAAVPTFNIIINPASASSKSPSVNHILFPRQSLNTIKPNIEESKEPAN